MSGSIRAAIAAGNVNLAGAAAVEQMELSEGSKRELEAHAAIIAKYETQKRARTMIVPTAVEDVKAQLRSLGHPVTLFGEGPFDRRERLKEVLAQAELATEAASGSSSSSSFDSQQLQQEQQRMAKKEVIYTPASEELVAARKILSTFSFDRAHQRLHARRKVYTDSETRSAEDAQVAGLQSHCKELAINLSAAAEERPLVSVRFSPTGSLLATGSLGGSVKLWDPVRLEQCGNLRAHEERIMSLAWRPAEGGEFLASAGADGKCVLWDCRASSSSSSASSASDAMDVAADEAKEGSSSSGSGGRGRILHTLLGHRGAVADVDFHPSGRFVGTAGHDNTWRLWDVETAQELLLQDGHIKECSTISFQQDGALCLTGDAAGVILLWDLRSGQAVHVCQGHVKKISALTFNPNGFVAASSSVDNMIRIWDFRKKKCSHCIPAHANAISEVRYSASGEMLLSCSFDATIKVWSARDHRLVRTLAGHHGKVMSADWSSDERHIASAGYDRTLKLWSCP